MKCTWEEHGMPDERGWRTVRCTRCGLVTAPTPHDFSRIHSECLKPGIGDYVKFGLAAFGITQGRASWLAQKLGLSRCPCPEAQEVLNEVGKRIGL